jgi:hypothetical protein
MCKKNIIYDKNMHSLYSSIINLIQNKYFIFYFAKPNSFSFQEIKKEVKINILKLENGNHF